MEPGDPGILTHLGELFVRRRDVPRAVEAYRRALTRNPTDKLAREIQTKLGALGARNAAGR